MWRMRQYDHGATILAIRGSRRNEPAPKLFVVLQTAPRLRITGDRNDERTETSEVQHKARCMAVLPPVTQLQPQRRDCLW